MNWHPITLLLTLVGGLATAALIGWIRKSRLILFVPRLFSFSMLGAKGQLAELSVFNRGWKTEEGVEVSLSPNFTYEIIGSNSQDVKLDANKLLISRIGAGDDVTTILLAEGGVFSADEITNCLSKESKGKTVKKLEDVTPTGPQRIALVVVFIMFPAAIYLAYSGISAYFSREISEVGAAATASATKNAVAAVDSSLVRDWVVPKYARTTGGAVYEAFNSGQLDLKIGAVTRKKDVVTVPVLVENKSKLVVQVDVTMNSVGSKGRIPSFKLSNYDSIAVPGVTMSVPIDVVIPVNGKDFERDVYLEVSLKATGGGVLHLSRVYAVQ